MLCVWLPLNGDLHNQGASEISATNTNAVINTAGKIGSCYYMQDTTSTIYTDLFIPETNNFSFCCWYKAETSTSGYVLGLSRAKEPSLMLFKDGTTRFRLYLNSYSTYTHNLDITEWHHYTITYDSNKAILYIDGQSQLEREQTVDFTSNEYRLFLAARSNSNNTIGNISNHCGPCYYNDIRYYNHCLSAAEVREISQGLVLHYKLNGIRQNYILNSSGVFLTNLGSASGSRQEYRAKTLGQNLPITSGTTITISFDLYMEFNTANPYLYVYNTNNKGPHQTINGINALAGRTVQVGDIINERISVTGTITDRDSPTQTTDFIEFYSNYGSNNWFSISNIKLEIGNNATPYIPAEMNLPNIIEDSSGYNHNGTVIHGTASLSSNTARYNISMEFNGYQNPTIDSTNSSFLSALTNCTVTWWEYVTVSGNNLPIRAQDTQHFIGAGSTTKKLYHNNIGSVAKLYKDGVAETSSTYSNVTLTSSNIVYTQNQWSFFALSGANLSTWTKIELNGYSSTWPVNGNISDLRIYSTALSAEDILSLYHTSAKVDNKQNFHTFELVENSSAIKINKRGQTLCNELEENTATKFYKTNQIIETNEIIEL